MMLGLKRRFVVGAVAVAALVPMGAATAAACGGGHANDPAAVNVQNQLFDHGTGLLSAAAGYLGLTKDAVNSQLVSGQSLAQIADATPGKSSAGLVDALDATVKTNLDNAVAGGKITSAQETTILADATSKVQTFVDAVWTSPAPRVASDKDQGSTDHQASTEHHAANQHSVSTHGHHGRHHHR